MAARKRRPRPHRARTNDPASAMAESAQRIWLAGLGAFERAREEGPKMFDVLVEQGRELGGKARDAAEQALRGLPRFQKLSPDDVSDLARQVRELGETVRRMATSPGGGRKSAAPRGAAKRKVKRAAGAKTRRQPRKPRP